MAAVTICSDFGAPQNKVWHCFHCFSIYFPWSDGTRCHDLHFLNVAGSIISWQVDGETIETVTDLIFLGLKITVDSDCSHEIKRCLLLGVKSMTNLDSVLKSRDVTLPTKVYLVKAMDFPVVMYRCESCTIEKAKHWRIDASNCGVGEDFWSPLDCKEIQAVNLKGNQSWIFIGRTDAEAPTFWPPDAKIWLIWNEPDADKDWRQEEKGTTEDEMVGWHHWLNGHGFG